MSRINILDSVTANAIKAGEVIERPVSVIKELVDNSIDAGASAIKIEFENGGIGLIRVSDNGIGMDHEDAVKSFIIHATSKINSIEDIYDLSTQGFRGEALASISACSEVKMITRQADTDSGYLVRYDEGKIVEEHETAADVGTVVEVSRLFANIPARYKFLKKDSTEGMYICTLVEKLAIINPEISFKLIKDGKQILSTPGSGDMKDAIYSIYGKSIASNLIPVEYEYEDYRITGFTGKTDLVRGNRAMQYVYVNNRAIRSSTITAAIDEAYKNAVMKGKFPICFLSVYASPGKVDVNVHPQKSEVRFDNDSDVFKLVYHGIRNSVFSNNDANHQFRGLVDNREAPEIVKEAVEKKADDSHQLRMNFSSQISSPTKQESDATREMLEILSQFRPNLAEISSDDSAYTSNKEVELLPVASNPVEVTNETETQIVDEPSVEISDKEYSNDIDELSKSNFIGIIFDTYIIMQSKENVFFVDQHAAHERVLFEKVMNKKLNQVNPDNIQVLLVPQILDLSSADYSFVTDNIDKFNESGFELEIMGERQIAIRAVPVMGRNRKPSELFQNVLLDLKKETPEKSSVWYALIQMTACKAAIKAHDKITKEEALELIRQMSLLVDPYHCAHGRPTFIKVSMTDMEKNFKRIV